MTSAATTLPDDTWRAIAHFVGHHVLSQTCHRLRRLLRNRHWCLTLRWSGGGVPLSMLWTADTVWIRLSAAASLPPSSLCDHQKSAVHLPQQQQQQRCCPWLRLAIDTMEAAVAVAVDSVVVVEAPCGSRLRRGPWGPWWRATACFVCDPCDLWHPLWPHRAAAALEEEHGGRTSGSIVAATIRDFVPFVVAVEPEKRIPLPIAALRNLSPLFCLDRRAPSGGRRSTFIGELIT